MITLQDILVTGSGGALGTYCSFGTRVGRDELDVTDLREVMRVCEDKKPKVIVHCAAMTDLAFCEQNPDKAYLVNSAGTYHMALGARNVGAKLIYISTSDVFDGKKADPYIVNDIPNPTTVYGRSKHLGELSIKGILDDYVIMRISWMFGGGPQKDSKFVGKILMQKNAPEIRAVTDTKASPAWAKDIAGAVQKLLEEDRRGICHVGGGSATRYDMAREIASIAGWKTEIVPVLSSAFPSAYPIGKNQSMPVSPLVRPWQEALEEYIHEEWHL